MTTPAKAAKPKSHPLGTIREGVETISFVVALVLMLKLFVVEAFVIPTGSMAETLYGYNKLAQCPSCGFEYPVNTSDEVEPSRGAAQFIAGGCCPNCRYRMVWDTKSSPGNRSGDRVLVHKATYHLNDPDRGDVVVFRYPVDPQASFVTNNYIKRLWGQGDETIAIYRGDLYVAKGLKYPAEARNSFGQLLYPRPEDPNRLWEGVGPSMMVSRTEPLYQMLGQDFTYHNADLAVNQFKQDLASGFTNPNGFKLIRKADATAIEMRRPVFDNEHQSKFLAKQGVPPRWKIEGQGFDTDAATMPKVFKHKGTEVGTLRYLHRVGGQLPVDDPLNTAPESPDIVLNSQLKDWQRIEQGYQEGLFQPAPITNFFGYNGGLVSGGRGFTINREASEFWVGDLMLESTISMSSPSDEVVLELAKGANRFQLKFSDSQMSLSRTGPAEKVFLTMPSPIKTGTYDVRFANVDCRLRVWINGKRIELGDAADYSPADTHGFEEAAGGVISGALAPWISQGSPTADALAQPGGMTLHNDLLAPATIRVKGTVEVSKLKLFQDTFFTPSYDSLRSTNVDTFYVQPGHYLCLGDNSGHSSDSRAWGLVPKRLMLGKAIFVFYPFNRLGFIR